MVSSVFPIRPAFEVTSGSFSNSFGAGVREAVGMVVILRTSSYRPADGWHYGRCGESVDAVELVFLQWPEMVQRTVSMSKGHGTPDGFSDVVFCGCGSGNGFVAKDDPAEERA